MSMACAATARSSSEATSLRARRRRAAGSPRGPRLLAALLLGVLAWTIASPTLASTLPSEAATGGVPDHHADGVPCPDGGDEGPCHDGCPCFCCPGHSSALFAPTPVALDTPDLIALQRAGPAESVRPTGFRHRLFRPPRV